MTFWRSDFNHDRQIQMQVACLITFVPRPIATLFQLIVVKEFRSSFKNQVSN